MNLKRKPLLVFCGAAAVAFAVAAVFAWTSFSIAPALSNEPGWEAVAPRVGVGKAVRLEVRLKGAVTAPQPQEIKVTSTRLDMGPDGMAMMEASLKAASSGEAGVVAFEADLAMAGRWELTLTAAVPGLPRPVSGTVIFTAIDKKPKGSELDPGGKPRKIAYYRNPMGLPDISPVPKKDSMGMDYIPVYEDEISGPAGSVSISLDKVQRAGVRTQKIERRALGKSILATGTVTPDEARVWITSAKFSGFVEKLHVAVTGAKVKAGERLMTVWIENGDLLRKQADYLTALKTAGANDRDGALARARANLATFDFPDETIEELARTRQPTRKIVMRSRAAGTIIEKPAIEGMRFETGHLHFKIADLSTVWVIAEVAERDLGFVRPGQKARMSFIAYPGETFEGRVSFIYPDVNMTARTGRVRIELPNRDDRIKIGLYADVKIEAESGEGPVLAVPESAVIDNGERRVVMVAKGDGRYEPRDIETGLRGNGHVEVRKGLEEGEEIVTTGNFLIDAESNLRAALTAFTADSADGNGTPATVNGDASGNTPVAASPPEQDKQTR